jgi:hypothetical protein
LTARNLLASPAGPVLTLGEHLVVLRAWFEADAGQVSAATQQRLDALLAAASSDEKGATIDLVDRIGQRARAQEQRRLAPPGMAVATLRARLDAMAARTRKAPPWCTSEWDLRCDGVAIGPRSGEGSRTARQGVDRLADTGNRSGRRRN